EFKGISQHGSAFLYAGDDIRTADPMGFGVIGGRPLRRVIGMRMVEADDVFFALAGFALDAHQFFGVDVVAVLRRVGSRVARAGDGSNNSRAIIFEAPEEHAAALVRIGLLAMLAKRVVMGLAKAKHSVQLVAFAR